MIASQEEAMKLRDQKKEVESLRGYSNVEISELKKQIETSYDQQLGRITEMVIFICQFLLHTLTSDLSRGFMLGKF